ncbi:MAG: hypothetical protein AB7O39_09740 [Flavobacteriaceae bacterium]
MTDSGEGKPGGASKREKRLAEALRQNLARRKAQGRARREEASNSRQTDSAAASDDTEDGQGPALRRP